MSGGKLKFHVQYVLRLKPPKAIPKASVKRISVGIHEINFVIEGPFILYSIALTQRLRSEMQSVLNLDLPFMAG